MKKILFCLAFAALSFALIGCAHTHTPAEAVRENEISATCMKEGSYDSVVYCADCSEEISRTPTVAPRLAHLWENGTCTDCHAGLPALSLSDDGTYYRVIGGEKNNRANIVIPETYNGLPVAEIANGAFKSRYMLRYVTIPGSVTRIGSNAFYDCTALLGVTIEHGVKVIRDYAFEGCESLKSITIPGSVSTIMYRAFAGCTSLADVTIGEGVTAIESGAFSDCRRLKSITLPSTITTLGDGVFSDCRSLESVVLSSGLKTMGSSIFNWCTSLKSITIPASVTEIGRFAFDYCDALEKIVFESTSRWNVGGIDPNGSNLTPIDVTSPAKNVSNFTGEYESCWWYKR